MKNRAFGNKLICPGLSLNSQANKHLSLPQGLRANIEFGSERIPRRLLWGEASEYPNGITPLVHTLFLKEKRQMIYQTIPLFVKRSCASLRPSLAAVTQSEAA